MKAAKDKLIIYKILKSDTCCNIQTLAMIRRDSTYYGMPYTIKGGEGAP